MQNQPLTHGNLALAVEAPAPSRMDFTVIDGGKKIDTRLVERPKHSAKAHLLAAMLLIAAIAVSITIAAGRSYLVRSAAIDSLEFENVTVEAGDSLWSIAERSAVPGLSTDELVQVVRDHNGLQTSTLQPGQVIAVPR